MLANTIHLNIIAFPSKRLSLIGLNSVLCSKICLTTGPLSTLYIYIYAIKISLLFQFWECDAFIGLMRLLTKADPHTWLANETGLCTFYFHAWVNFTDVQIPRINRALPNFHLPVPSSLLNLGHVYYRGTPPVSNIL